MSESNAVNPTVEEPPANRFTADATDRAARVRAVGEAFPDEADPRTLTTAELRLARGTSIDALEKAAVFAEATPQIGGVDVDEIREMIAFELAYGAVRDEAKALARRIDRIILRRKVKVARTVRALYRTGKGYVTFDAGDAVRPHLDEMQRTLVPPRRRKAAPADTEPAVKK